MQRRQGRRMIPTVPWQVLGRPAARDQPLQDSNENAFLTGISIERELTVGIRLRLYLKSVNGTLKFQLEGVEGINDRSQVFPERHGAAKQYEEVGVAPNEAASPTHDALRSAKGGGTREIWTHFSRMASKE